MNVKRNEQLESQYARFITINHIDLDTKPDGGKPC